MCVVQVTRPDPLAPPISSKGLPLPANLMLHRSLCVQEDIECQNVLLGDKASWIGGIVDEVTFCVGSAQITAHLIDGSSVALPVTHSCLNMLQRVIEHVQLSFAPPPRPAADGGRDSASTASSARRSTSGLLLTLLSPLLSQTLQQQQQQSARSQPPQNPSRLHRRQARSLLVDAYRCHVLPALKEVLPQNYLLWTIQGEMAIKRAEWESAKEDVEKLLEVSGHRYAAPKQVKRAMGSSLGRSSATFDDSTSSLGYSSASSSDDESAMPTTPATSVFNSREAQTLSPLAHLSSLPPASSVLASQRPAYAALVSRLANLASRLSSLKKLANHLEREDGRRKWLEGMEASRLAERSLRRAATNKSQAASLFASLSTFRPLRVSPLSQCVPATVKPVAPHPAMEDEDEGVVADDSVSEVSGYMSVDASEDDEEILSRGMRNATRMFAAIPTMPQLDSEDSDIDDSPMLETPPALVGDCHKQLGRALYDPVQIVQADEADRQIEELDLHAFAPPPAYTDEPTNKTASGAFVSGWRNRHLEKVQVVA